MSQDGPLWPTLPHKGQRRDKRTREREQANASAPRARTERPSAPPVRDEDAPRPRVPTAHGKFFVSTEALNLHRRFTAG